MKAKLTKMMVDSIKPAEKVQLYWDKSLKGFGVRVTPAGRKTFVVQYRTGGRGSPSRRLSIGKYGILTVDQAKKEALIILAQVATGHDPHASKQAEKQAITMDELCDDYLKHGCTMKKESTIATDKGRIETHIKPLLGKRKVKDLTSNDVRRFMKNVAEGMTARKQKTKKHGISKVTGGKGTATRTVGLLGGILSYAVSEGCRSDNPVHGVKRYKDRKNERYLSIEEIANLGSVLSDLDKEGKEYPYAIAAIRLLLLTGCRKSEILKLTWAEVDYQFGCLRLKDSKTGQKIVPVGAPVLVILNELPRIEKSPYVLPAQRGDGHYIGLPKVWHRIRERAGLDGVRLHDLRHSFASVGAGAGLGLPIVGKLLGHSDPKTTNRYAHIADDPLKAAADRVAGTIAGQLEGKKTPILPIRARGASNE